MKEINSVAILGAGAMGAFYASKFGEVFPSSTAFVARDSRCERLREEGLLVNGRPYSIPVIHPEDKTFSADLIIVAVKNHHLAEAVHDLKSVIHDQTTILSVMNGLDSEEYIGSIYGMDKVLYSVAVGIDAVRQRNSVTYTNEGKICFGEADNSRPSQRVERVKEAFERARIAYEIPRDMMRAMWWKFMINVGINQSSAVLRAPYGVFLASPDAKALVDSLMNEVITLAQREGVNLSQQDLEAWYGVLKTLSPLGKTSMLQDIEAGRKTEVETFAGKVVDLGIRHGIPTPVNQTMLNIIHVLEQP